MAAEMRHRLIDHARRRLAEKRGGGVIHEALKTGTMAVMPGTSRKTSRSSLGQLDDALEQLTASFPRAAQVVQLRFLAGLTTDETAAALGLSAGTIKREWTFARAWLAAALNPESRGSGLSRP